MLTSSWCPCHPTQERHADPGPRPGPGRRRPRVGRRAGGSAPVALPVGARLSRGPWAPSPPAPAPGTRCRSPPPGCELTRASGGGANPAWAKSPGVMCCLDESQPMPRRALSCYPAGTWGRTQRFSGHRGDSGHRSFPAAAMLWGGRGRGATPVPTYVRIADLREKSLFSMSPPTQRSLWGFTFWKRKGLVSFPQDVTVKYCTEYFCQPPPLFPFPGRGKAFSFNTSPRRDWEKGEIG